MQVCLSLGLFPMSMLMWLLAQPLTEWLSVSSLKDHPCARASLVNKGLVGNFVCLMRCEGAVKWLYLKRLRLRT